MYVKVTGTSNALRALRQLDPELAKEIGKDLAAAGRTIANDAKALIPSEPPMRNWRTTPAGRPRGRQSREGVMTSQVSRGGRGWPEWTGQKYRASLRTRRRQFELTIDSARDPAGMIYELAGTKGGRGRNSAGSPQGRQFIANLSPVRSSTAGRRSSRAMVQSLKRNYRGTRTKLEQATDRTMTRLQRLLDG